MKLITEEKVTIMIDSTNVVTFEDDNQQIQECYPRELIFYPLDYARGVFIKICPQEE